MMFLLKFNSVNLMETHIMNFHIDFQKRYIIFLDVSTDYVNIKYPDIISSHVFHNV